VAEVLQRGQVVADALGKDTDHPAGAQHVPTAGQGGAVVLGPLSVGEVAGDVGAPVHRDHAGEGEERPERDDLPQCRLAQEVGEALPGRHEDDGVDQSILVVGDLDDGPAERNVVVTGDLQASEENPDHRAGQPSGGPVGEIPGRHVVIAGRSTPTTLVTPPR
jgi:hypothetical protein